MSSSVFVRVDGQIILAERVVAAALPEFRVWEGMLNRCRNPKHPGYERYGGAGIAVCARWKKFKLFYEDMGPRPGPGYSIDRTDGTKGYELDNCSWATRGQQSLNKKNAVFVEYEGEQERLILLCQRLGVAYPLVITRLKKGWDVKRAVETPLGKVGRPRKSG